MRVAHAETTPLKPVCGLRGGKIEFQTLLEGNENTPDNYHVLLANTDISFKSPRHRHNFEQIRYSLVEPTNIGKGRNLDIGDIGYFPECTYYGPQNQEEVGKTSLNMVIQFAGPSGSGFLSQRQFTEAFDKMQAFGRFEGGVFRRNEPAPDGRMNQDAYEAIWEFVNGRKLEYAKPRYIEPVYVHEDNFAWQPLADCQGVDYKPIGYFNEKGVALFVVRIAAGAQFTLAKLPQTRVVFFKHGTGRIGKSDTWSKWSALHTEVGETPTLKADTETELLVLHLPRFG